MFRLLFIFMFTLLGFRTITGEGKMTCQEFTADISLRNLIDIGQTKAQPCPCIEQIIAIDYTFEKKKNCYRQWLFTDDVKQVCCYSDTGLLILDGSGAGYLLLKSREDYIDHAHDTCCRDGSITYDFKTCRSFYQINPPDNCSSYVPPRVSLSSGDPMIQTIDGEKYSFNGHGEYVFLTDNKTFEIQARTEYVVRGNNDSTYFSAFAMKDIKSTEQIELHYNKDSEVIHLYRNGTIISNCSSTSSSNENPKPCEIEQHKCFVLAGNKKIIIQQCGFQNYVQNMEFSTDNFMAVQINIQGRTDAAKNLMGLAGDTENGSYIMRNTSTVSVNGSELQLFEFAETWSLQNENESIFRYNETGGNYTLYNHHHTRPEFLEDKLGDLTELFEGYPEDNIKQFNQTCRNYWNNKLNNQCLLTIARTKNYTLGLAVMREANATRHDYEILHNKPPTFTYNTPTFLNVSYGSTKVLDLKKYARDDFDATDKIQYRVFTKLTEYNIVNGVFNWTVGKELRYDDFRLTFMLNDTLGFNAQYDMNIFYCGCEQNSQCDYNRYNKNSSDTVMKALCNCPEYTSGLYCEIEEDPCKSFHCDTTCNRTLSRTLPSWPCEECHEGRRNNIVNKIQTCENINECASLHIPCEQSCNDTDGSYVCGCHDGYTLNVDKHTCDDINECASMHNSCEQLCNDTDGSYICGCYDGYKLNVDKQTCDDINECQQDHGLCPSKNEICVNTRGNYSCICPPGYVFTGNMCTKSGSVEDVVNVKCSDSTWDIELDMNQLQTQYPGVRSNEIFLGESKCLGKQEGSILKFQYDLHNCKTANHVSGITHIYNNKLFYAIFDPVIPFLIRRHIWTFTVECDVIKGGTGTSHLHHGIETHHATYVNHFNVSVNIYSDQNFRNPIVRDADSIHIGDDVFVKVTTDIADWNTKMRLHTCLTKPYVNASSDSDVVLIRNGCEADRNTHIISQSTHETSFMFKDFEYLTNDEGLDIYCNATFCDTRDFSPECSQSCYRGPPIIG